MISRRTMLGMTATGVSISRFARAGSAPTTLVTVLTCPRPAGVNYLDGTLDAVDADLAGHDRLLICDGVPVERLGWQTVTVPARPKHHGQRPDNRGPGWSAIDIAANRGMSLLFLEDDIRPATPGAFARMAATRPGSGADFVSFFHRNRSPGIYGARSFEMSQAVLLPASTVARLAAMRWRCPGDWEAMIGVDLAISTLAEISRMHFEQTENLIHHIGVWSAAEPGKQRTF